MLSKMTNRDRLITTANWAHQLLIRALKRIFGQRQRFYLLTPPMFSTAWVLDAARRRVITINIRDVYDFWVASQIFVHHDYSLEKLRRNREIFASYRELVAAGRKPLIIDCGGNSGMATRYFADTFPDAFVVCVEPDHGNIEAARKNNVSKNVAFLEVGVGSADTRGTISDPGEGNWAYQVKESAAGNVRIVSINTILAQYADFAPFLIKIDIEGFEENLFERNTEWIDRFSLLIIELHDWMLPTKSNSRNFLREMSKRDRDFVFFGENVFSISNRTTS